MRNAILLLLVTVMLTACSGDDAPEATATATQTPLPLRPTLPPFPTRAPEPSPTPVTAHPDGTRTGVEIVDDVLATIEAGDAAALEAALSFHPYRCDNAPSGTAGSNPCPPGVPDGSAVDVIALGRCEVSFVARERADLGQELGQFALSASQQRVYAVTEVAEGRLASPLPLRYLVILTGGYTLLLDDAGVTHLGLPCEGVGPADLYHPADRTLLAPL